MQNQRGLETANEAWNEILSGKLRGFSIHAEIEKNGSHKEGEILVLDKLRFFEISVCSKNSAVNKQSMFEVISKCEENEGGKNMDEVENEIETEGVITEIAKDEDEMEKRMDSLEKKLDDFISAFKDGKYPMPGAKKSESAPEPQFSLNNELSMIRKAVSDRDALMRESTKEFEDVKKLLSALGERIKKIEEIPQDRKTVISQEKILLPEYEDFVIEKDEIYVI